MRYKRVANPDRGLLGKQLTTDSPRTPRTVEATKWRVTAAVAIQRGQVSREGSSIRCALSLRSSDWREMPNSRAAALWL